MHELQFSFLFKWCYCLERLFLIVWKWFGWCTYIKRKPICCLFINNWKFHVKMNWSFCIFWRSKCMCDNNSEIVCVLFIQMTTVCKIVDLMAGPLSYLYTHLFLLTIFLLSYILLSLLFLFVYKAVFYVKRTELEWCLGMANILY